MSFLSQVAAFTTETISAIRRERMLREEQARVAKEVATYEDKRDRDRELANTAETTKFVLSLVNTVVPPTFALVNRYLEITEQRRADRTQMIVATLSVAPVIVTTILDRVFPRQEALSATSPTPPAKPVK